MKRTLTTKPCNKYFRKYLPKKSKDDSNTVFLNMSEIQNINQIMRTTNDKAVVEQSLIVEAEA